MVLSPFNLQPHVFIMSFYLLFMTVLSFVFSTLRIWKIHTITILSLLYRYSFLCNNNSLPYFSKLLLSFFFSFFPLFFVLPHLTFQYWFLFFWFVLEEWFLIPIWNQSNFQYFAIFCTSLFQLSLPLIIFPSITYLHMYI